jgi:hypothetical protein
MKKAETCFNCGSEIKGVEDRHIYLNRIVCSNCFKVYDNINRPDSMRTSDNELTFTNPLNGYTETSSCPWFWTLLFGPLYFAAKGVWTHFIAGILLGLMTCGLSWFVYPFFANGIIRNYYLRRGWRYSR